MYTSINRDTFVHLSTNKRDMAINRSTSANTMKSNIQTRKLVKHDWPMAGLWLKWKAWGLRRNTHACAFVMVMGA